MVDNRIVVSICCLIVLMVSACSRQQSDWQKTRAANTADAYEHFLKSYPTGEFTAQAQARVKELNEERDWQKARDTDTAEAYQAFVKQHPEGKWSEEAHIRVENFTLAQAPSGAGATPAPSVAGTAAPVPKSPATMNKGLAPSGAAGPGTAAAPDTELPDEVSSDKTSPHSGATAPGALAPAITTRADATRQARETGSRARARSAALRSASKSTLAHAEKAGARSYGVQLGAFKSGASAAHQRWSHLRKEYPSLLAGLSSRVVMKKTSAGRLYRLQATGATEKRARSLCKHLKSKSQACVVVRVARA